MYSDTHIVFIYVKLLYKNSIFILVIASSM